MTSGFRSLWRNLRHRDRVERDLRDELAATYEHLVDEKIREGRRPSDARREASLQLNGMESVKEQVRQSLAGAGCDALLQDIRYSVRALRRSPSFAISAMLSLTLGVGAVTLVFSVVNGLLLRPLPIPDPSRVVFLVRMVGNDATSNRPHTYADYRVFQDRNRAFESLAGYTQFPVGFDVRGAATRQMPAFVTGTYFDALGITPSFGRLLTPADDRDGADPAAVLDYDFWTSAYDADPRILGSKLRVTAGRAAGAAPDTLYTIVGIAPKGFHGTDISIRPQVWMPLHALMSEPRLAARNLPGPALYAFGRLKPGISAAAAESNAAAIAHDLAREFPAVNAGYAVRLADSAGWLRNWPVLRSFASGTLLLAGLVLLAACASIATGLTVRTIDRHREIGIRMSLGAGRLRVVRLILIEVLVIASASAAFALAIVAWATRILSGVTLPGDPLIQVDVHPDIRVFLLATAVSLLASTIATVAAGRAIAGIDPNRSLKGLDGVFSDRRWTARDALTATQVLFSCVLMGACVLSLVALKRALTLPIGFDVDRVATVTIDFDVAKYSREQQRSFMERAVAAVRVMPGVQAAAYVGGLPLGLIQNYVFVAVNGRPLPTPQGVLRYPITDDYFRAMGVRLVDGQELTARDTGKALVNEAFVRQILQSNLAVGAHVGVGNSNHLESGATEALDIVGVVADGKYLSLSESPRPTIFTPLSDTPFGRPTMVIRTAGSPAATAASVRRVLTSLDPALPLRNVGSAAEVIAPAFLPNRAAAATLTGFGLVAMLLAVTGIHGVVSYAVAKRRREIGVRVALGATKTDVVRGVLGRVALTTVVGIALGVLATLALARVLAQVVYLASANEPIVLGGVMTVMVFAVGVAVIRPTTRAIRIEPMVALRSE